MRRLRAFGILAAGLLAASPALAARPLEAQAVSVFHATCVLNQGDAAGIDKKLAPLVEKKRAASVPAADLAKRTGMKVDHAWIVTSSDGADKFLVTTEPGICALHMSAGDPARVREDFKAAAQLLADAAKGTLDTREESKTKDSVYQLYSVELPNAKTQPTLALTTTDRPAASGTKHLMTFSVTRK